jgi:hypothetical protein
MDLWYTGLSGLRCCHIVVGARLGSVTGPVIIGHPSTLAAGIIWLLTLLCYEAIIGLRG